MADAGGLVFILLLFVGTILLVSMRIWKSDWAKRYQGYDRKERSNIAGHLQSKDPPGITEIIIACIIIIGLPILSGTMLAEWDQRQGRQCSHSNLQDEDRMLCDEYLNEEISWFDTTENEYGNPTINEGFTTNSQVGPDGPTYWIGYCLLSLIMLIGFGNLTRRDWKQRRALAKAERAQLTVVRKLALDPDGVVEGRIIMPDPVPSSEPTSTEKVITSLIPIVLGMMIGFTLFALFTELIEPGDSKSWEGANLQLILSLAYTLLLLVVGVACWYTMRAITMTLPGEDESLIPQVFKAKDSAKEEAVDEEEVEEESEEVETEPRSQIQEWELQEDGWNIDPTILNTWISCFLIIGPMFVLFITGGDHIKLYYSENQSIDGPALLLTMILAGFSMWIWILTVLSIRWADKNRIYSKIKLGPAKWDNKTWAFVVPTICANIPLGIMLWFGIFENLDDTFVGAVILLSFEIFYFLELKRRDAKHGRFSENTDGSWSTQEEAKAPRETPVAMNEIVTIMEEKLASALAEAEELRGDLVITQERVQNLEREIVNKDFEIIELEEVKDKIKTELEEKMETQEESDGKGLSLQDSVMVGDNLFGSTKIDQQIVNDPEAIARAAIAAYRQGKEESKDKRPDILL